MADSKPWVVVHPTGNTYSRSSLSAIEQAGLLESFWTAFNWDDKNPINRFLPRSIRKELCRRHFDEAPREKIHSVPMRECLRMLGAKLNMESLSSTENAIASVDSVFHGVDQAARKHVFKNADHIRGVFSCEDAAFHSFKAAKDCNLSTAYDLPIAYWDYRLRIYQEEAERLPAWAQTLQGSQDSKQKLERKTEEFALADTVFCPSQFVIDTLPKSLAAKKQIVFTPFGSPVIPWKAKPKKSKNTPLRILFAGSMTQRKGLADVFSAMKQVDRKSCKLVVMGTPIAPLSFYQSEYPNFEYEAPRPHNEVLELMRSCDVLVLPSLIEGRALVIQEAMACGLPVIITPNTGATDLVITGETGFEIPIRSPEKIAEKLCYFADNKDQLPAMAQAAREKAATVTWDHYNRLILQALQSTE